MMKSIGMLLAAAVALAGCGDPAADTAAPAAGAEPAAHRELLDAARQPLERAQSVEGIEAEHKRATDALIEEQTR